MKPLQDRYQIRLNLIDLVAESVNEGSDASIEAFLEMLRIYRADTVRKMQGQQGSLDYMFDHLKVGIRLAGSLMQEVQEEESASLAGWYMGSKPKNMVHSYYNLLAETASEFSLSVMDIEAQYPHLQNLFDLERDADRSVREESPRKNEEVPA